ncbi:unnamed protein product, partial [Mesorhabditis belari]|uniref:Sarcosine oxidasee (formaldehyde-forming) n=1 Tax=Mesorhabditis belari TaxID=2138241 RepID=A0AAF3EE81_9BILA
MSNSVYDVIVIGAGIVGSCTAYHCCKLGLKTLQIEQFNLGHWHGSSHGMSRITRFVHSHPSYVPIVKDTFEQITEFEAKLGEKLWEKTGMLWTASDEMVDILAKASIQTGLEHEVLSSEQINARFPQMSFGSEWRGIYDPNGGMIYADKWLKIYQGEYRALGGLVHENEAFLGVSESNGVTQVTTDKKTYTTLKLVIGAGTWLQTVLPEIAAVTRLQLERIAVGYWKCKDPQNISLFTTKMPVVIIRDKKTKRNDNLLPIRDYSDGIKYFACQGPILDANDEDVEGKSLSLDIPRANLSVHFPMIDSSTPLRVDACKFTMSPDKHYVFDWHPKYKNVLIGGCMSGSGFKVAPGLGRALANLAAGNKSPFDLSIFSLKRFDELK